VLKSFLNSKPLYYDKIDYTRMPRVYDTIKKKIKLPKIIHIIGTNGKGTTGRFLATALHSLGKKVGHYTSPHILNFNERIWINGEDICDSFLDKSHLELLKILSKEDADSLSYFEYTTLLAIYIYQDMEYVVLEAGLGGERDATAVFAKCLTLVTPIDIDHEAFLGSDIESIAVTKLNAIQNIAIMAKQKHRDVETVAQKLVSEKKIQILAVDTLISSSDDLKIRDITLENSLAPYLQNNLTLAIAALNYMKLSYEVKDFKNSRLFGRLTQMSENVLLDVGHNVLAAKSIYESLKGSQYTLIYNSYRDKNYREILEILKPIVSEIEIIKIDDKRVEDIDILESLVKEMGFDFKVFSQVDSRKNYLVFGSFSVVEEFLRVANE
jgi:dihydrofolate synthase/folylpolyglutamate synthase